MPFLNRFRKIKYSVQGIDIAVASQGSNFTEAKIRTALKQAFSLWTAYAPIYFEEVGLGEQEISIEFQNYPNQTFELGSTEFGNTIKINTTNLLFIDKENENDLPIAKRGYYGPYDLVFALAHEIGHALGIDHPPLIDNIETPPGALMGRSVLSKTVKRQLNEYDITSVQSLHGATRIADTVTTDLAQSTQINTWFNDLHFIKNIPGFVQVDGPVGHRFGIYIFIPGTKKRKVNAVGLKYRTHLANTIVNSVEVFDGIIPLQTYYLNTAVGETAAAPFHDWNMKLGLHNRPDIKNGILLKINIEFRQVQTGWDVGIIQITEASADCLWERNLDFPDISLLTESIFKEARPDHPQPGQQEQKK